MYLFFAGLVSSKPMMTAFKDAGYIERPKVGALVSYAYKSHYHNARAFGIEPIMVDSGAFSQTNTGMVIDHEAYLEYLLEERDNIKIAVALDDSRNPAVSLVNYDIARKEIPEIMPVWHVGEEWSLLDYYVDNAPWVGLGGVAGQRIVWRKLKPALEKVFMRYPTTRFHGFGINDFRLTVLPFYSCDAMTWRNGSRFGQIIMPDGQRLFVGRTMNAETPQEIVARGFPTFFEEHGIPYPFPEDMTWDLFDILNMKTLVALIVDREQTKLQDHMQASLF